MSDETFKDHLLDQLRQITDRLDRIEGALAEEPPAGPRNQRFWNENDEPVGVRYEERPGVFKWKADFKHLDRSYCKMCEAPIYWVRSKQGPGKSDEVPDGAPWVAVNPDGFCHFETCKQMDHDTPSAKEEALPAEDAATDVPF